MKKKIIWTSIFFMIGLIFVNIPSMAYFNITNFDIDAEVYSDGNMKVHEHIVYHTNETVNGVTRKIVIQNPKNKINSADNLQLQSVTADNSPAVKVSAGTNGQNGVFEYTKDNAEYNIKLYTPFVYGTKTVEYEYILENVAVQYNDIAELYWNFIGDEWDSSIQQLTINITLPKKAAYDTSYVFGHGSDNGSFVKNGNHITLQAYDIDAYQPIDARILFSKEAIPATTKIVNRSVLKEYIDKEEGLSKKMEAPKIIGNLDLNQIAYILTAIIIIYAVVVYILYDKEIKVEKFKYYREIPYDLDPEFLQYIYYGNLKNNAFYITVLNLIKKGVYRLEDTVNKVGTQDKKIIYNAKNGVELKEYQKSVVNSINGFLKKDENGELSLELLKLKTKMKNSSGGGYRKFAEKIKNEKEELFHKPAKVPKKIDRIPIFCMIALILIIFAIITMTHDIGEGMTILILMGMISIVYSLFFRAVDSYIAAMLFLIFHCAVFQGVLLAMMVHLDVGALYIPFICLFVLIQYTGRVQKYSKEERELKVKIAGLRRYIRDYSLLSEKEDLDTIYLWEDFFILAIALGLNRKTIDYFYDYGKEQLDSNLGVVMYGDTFDDFQLGMGDVFIAYQTAYFTTHSSSGSSYSGSSGGFSGGSSSGGGGRWRWRR